MRKVMLRRRAGWRGIVVGVLTTAATAAYAQTPDPAFLQQYCLPCHAGSRPAGGVSLSVQPGELSMAGRDPDRWEAVLRQLRQGAMPPPGAHPPPQQECAAFAAALEGMLDRAAAEAPRPGPPIVRRLNRFEYANSV